ncbi:MAG: Selenocysteine lyase/Cysteine desulfurase [Verrucomicrobia bacterium]|jgi:selenocysteine lyase/cysteine desulfurase|nr:MAG: Selenocysteine lyase/Cysteine desulfurase [Verrucomicrobiota bacterium]
MQIDSLAQLADEEIRRAAFPVCREKVFLAHAGVTALPRAVADAVIDYTDACTRDDQEYEGVLRRIQETRRLCADFIGAKPNEIALLGPTSLGLSLVANGLPWQPGDEVVAYLDDYPANVYPWMELERRGVRLIPLRPERPGEITPEVVARALTPRTRLVSLASAHFLTGYRIDIDAIGHLVHDHGALFCLDAIQTLGAFPTRVDHVDFLSADAHKWMLGPLAAGIVYVKETHFERLRPTLLGAWNVKSPGFVAQETVAFENGARRYEPGVLNCAGLFGMRAALELIGRVGLPQVSARLRELKQILVTGLKRRGFEIYGPGDGEQVHAITTCSHTTRDLGGLFQFLKERGIVTSFREDRIGTRLLRLSPHFYNTPEELEKVFAGIDAWT